MSAATILGIGVLAPPAGEARLPLIGDEADKAAKRLPRVDRMTLHVSRQALGTQGVDGLGLVVGTGYGGLGATVDFLEGVRTRGAGFGSPTAFHQSVHHSPAGQISLVLKITGPSLTCSARELSGEAALREAIDLLSMKRCQRVLVVCGDEVVPALESSFKAMDAPWAPSEGAAALLLGPPGGELEVASVAVRSEPLSMLKWSKPPPAGALVNPSGGLIRVALAAQGLAEGGQARVEGYSLGGGEAVVELRRR